MRQLLVSKFFCPLQISLRFSEAQVRVLRTTFQFLSSLSKYRSPKSTEPEVEQSFQALPVANSAVLFDARCRNSIDIGKLEFFVIVSENKQVPLFQLGPISASASFATNSNLSAVGDVHQKLNDLRCFLAVSGFSLGSAGFQVPVLDLNKIYSSASTAVADEVAPKKILFNFESDGRPEEAETEQVLPKAIDPVSIGVRADDLLQRLSQRRIIKLNALWLFVVILALVVVFVAGRRSQSPCSH
jgi:hypothetical protein